jgi:hypothetical protein
MMKKVDQMLSDPAVVGEDLEPVKCPNPKCGAQGGQYKYCGACGTDLHPGEVEDVDTKYSSYRAGRAKMKRDKWQKPEDRTVGVAEAVTALSAAKTPGAVREAEQLLARLGFKRVQETEPALDEPALDEPPDVESEDATDRVYVIKATVMPADHVQLGEPLSPGAICRNMVAHLERAGFEVTLADVGERDGDLARWREGHGMQVITGGGKDVDIE